MEESIFSYHTLPNGLRMVHRRCDSPVEYCGVAVNIGSRDELPGQFGLAHFVEHTIFKGTRHRKAWHILNRMEAVGGELNAYTTKEETMLYSIFPAGNLRRAVELLSDLILYSEFPTVQIDRERQVVADEIDSYLDSPSDAVFDDFEDMIFAGSGLGHNILGTREDIATFSSDVCRDYLKRFYTPGEMVFFYMGATPPDKVFRTAGNFFASLHHDTVPRSRNDVRPLQPFDSTKDSGNHQSNTVMGALIPGLYDPNRFAMALLTNMVGGPGMNSLLNVEVRERRGLVYTIEASSALFTDTGLFNVYFGCDHDDVARCRRMVTNTIDRLAQTPLPVYRLDKAKKQYLGQLTVASESREQAALSAGRATLLYGRARTPREVIDSINAISPEDILESAQSLTAAPLSTLTLA